VDTRRRLDAGAGVVREQRRKFDRDPAIDTFGGLENRHEHESSTAQVLQRQFEKQRFAGFPGSGFFQNPAIIGIAGSDCLNEDGRVRGQSGNAECIDVVLQRAVVENIPREVVQPEALPERTQ
jgi:hypothetical protein